MDVLVLSARDLSAVLDPRACLDAVAHALAAHEAGQSRGPSACGLTLAGGSFHVKTAALDGTRGGIIAAKCNVNLPDNLRRLGRPTIQGALVLLDADAGTPLAIMDASVLTSVRTAATAALAATHLSRPDASTITIVGCGDQATAQLRAMAAVRPIRRAYVADIDPERAEVFARTQSAELGFPVEVATDVGAAILSSDICVTCTTSTTSFIEAQHLHPGLFIAAVGADNPAKHEIHPHAMAKSRVVVDSLSGCLQGGDLHHAVAAGAMRAEDVHAELSAVVAGLRPGRVDADEVFVFDSTGTALQDVAAARLAYDQARLRGLGTRVEFGP